MSQYRGFYSVKSILAAASFFENREEVSHEVLIEFLQNYPSAQQSTDADCCDAKNAYLIPSGFGYDVCSNCGTPRK